MPTQSGPLPGAGSISPASRRCAPTCSRWLPARTCCCCVLHHIAGDGWSMAPLWRDLAVAYAAADGRRRRSWPPLPVQYADYTLWQRALLGDDERPGERARPPARVLARTLAGASRPARAADRPAAPAGASHPGRYAFRCRSAPPCTAACSALAPRRRASLFMVLQAGLAALLTPAGRGHRLRSARPSPGAPTSALDDLVGFFVNTLVLRTDLVRRPELPRADRRGCATPTSPPTPPGRCRSSGSSRRSTRRARWPAIRCSR